MQLGSAVMEQRRWRHSPEVQEVGSRGSFAEASSRAPLDIMTLAQTREYSPGIACTSPEARRKFRLIFHFYGEPIGG
jgi:hypothetical protein